MGHYDDQRAADDERQAERRAGYHDECVARIKGGKKTQFFDHIKRLDAISNKIPLSAEDRRLIEHICNLYLGTGSRRM